MGGIGDSFVRVGISTDPRTFGTLVHQSETLPGGSAIEIVVNLVADVPATYITLEAGLSWSFVDNVRLDPG